MTTISDDLAAIRALVADLIDRAATPPVDEAADLAIAIRRDNPDAVDIAFEATKTRQAPIPSFGAYFAFTPDKNDPRGLSEACFFGTGRPTPKVETMNAVDRAIHFIRLIQPQMMGQSEIVEAVKSYGVGRNRILEALETLFNSGELTITTGDRNAKLYSISGNETEY